MVARERLARGVCSTYPEAVALLSCWVIERARDGDATVEQLMRRRARACSRRDAGDGGRAGDARRGPGRGDVPRRAQARDAPPAGAVIPGRARVAARRRTSCAPGASGAPSRVANTGDRPIQVGSHFHFADVNAALEFDRAAARGFRLDVPAGTSVRFEPGVDARGRARRAGRRATRARALLEVTRRVSEIDRERYAQLYGPTTGDRVRLADTDLWLEVEEDRLRRRRRGGVRRRQDDPRVDAPGHRDARRRRARRSSSRTRSCSTTGASSRPTSGSATDGSSRSARPATRT